MLNIHKIQKFIQYAARYTKKMTVKSACRNQRNLHKEMTFSPQRIRDALVERSLNHKSDEFCPGFVNLGKLLEFSYCNIPFFFFFFFGYPMAYRIPRPGIRSKLQLRPRLQLWQHQVTMPAGDRTCVSKLYRHCPSRCTTVETPYTIMFLYIQYLSAYLVRIKCAIAFFFFFFLVFFAISFWAALAAYGGSQARGLLEL